MNRLEREVLRFIWLSCEMLKGYPSHADITEAVVVYDRALSLALGALVRRGLIQRYPFRKPGSAVRYMMTEAGRNEINAMSRAA